MKEVKLKIDLDAYHRLWLCSSRNASLYWITFGCFTDARIRTSLIAFSLSFSERCTSFTFFNAYFLLSCSLLTLKTFEYAPSPVTKKLIHLQIFMTYQFFQSLRNHWSSKEPFMVAVNYLSARHQMKKPILWDPCYYTINFISYLIWGYVKTPSCLEFDYWVDYLWFKLKTFCGCTLCQLECSHVRFELAQYHQHYLDQVLPLLVLRFNLNHYSSTDSSQIHYIRHHQPLRWTNLYLMLSSLLFWSSSWDPSNSFDFSTVVIDWESTFGLLTFLKNFIK